MFDLGLSAEKKAPGPVILPARPALIQRLPARLSPGAGRDLTRVPLRAESALPAMPALLSRAARDPAQTLEDGLRGQLEGRLGRDLTGVRVHRGAASAQAAAALGARAYTLGSRIHLGDEAESLAPAEQRELLAHEAVHTVQQGGAPVTPHAGLAVSRPQDAAEGQARRLAGDISRPEAAQATAAPAAGSVTPQVQRDLTGKRPAIDGDFQLDLKDKQDAQDNTLWGMLGTIKFKPNSKAPDAKEIRMLQVVKVVDVATGSDITWSGAEANRSKVMTAADKPNQVEAGFFVDHAAANVTPRTAHGDKPVSPYYRDYWSNSSMSQDGSKKGANIQEASLADFPRASRNQRFTFETAAQATKSGYIYASLSWGFRI
ncbi:MAG TPA: DUF4157 domain-containing protein, partial [Anaerolineaceae bacterium]